MGIFSLNMGKGARGQEVTIVVFNYAKGFHVEELVCVIKFKEQTKNQ